MNIDLVLMFGSLILLAVSGLLVFCFTESKGKNTPHARKDTTTARHEVSHNRVNKPITLDNELV